MERSYSGASGICEIEEYQHRNEEMSVNLMDNQRQQADLLKTMEEKLQEKYEHKLAAFKRQMVEDAVGRLTKEYEAKIAQAKTKQWCRNCLEEATSVCCFGTLYCSTACQQMDWTRHRSQCQRAHQL